MQLEYHINKPASLRGYPLHRMVMGLTDGKSALFADEGQRLVLRTEASVDAPANPIESPENGTLSAFELRACVSKKRKGKHIYFEQKDWRARQQWLDEKAAKFGFEVLTVHSTSVRQKIQDDRRRFWVDQTDFIGVLKVKDKTLFEQALIHGIGTTAKTFGFGLLVIH